MDNPESRLVYISFAFSIFLYIIFNSNWFRTLTKLKLCFSYVGEKSLTVSPKRHFTHFRIRQRGPVRNQLNKKIRETEQNRTEQVLQNAGIGNSPSAMVPESRIQKTIVNRWGN